MNRNETTWFGIRLTQKQATNLFVLSIVGVFITFFVVIQMFIPLIYMFTSPYGGIGYLWQSLFMLAPYYIAFLVGLILSIYSLIRSRKIARSYSGLMSTNSFKSKITMFCPNCGNQRSEEEKFCKQCGQEVK
ncbi:hypothetical protein LCGC14_1077970 [marine sediment metagenome]|uniref:Zinc-ribbon domain-containing protein n=1 Tax=marine sediment metagenome TaxID=412755 RepID=A0A0F9PZD8_9ZZZZ